MQVNYKDGSSELKVGALDELLDQYKNYLYDGHTESVIIGPREAIQKRFERQMRRMNTMRKKK